MGDAEKFLERMMPKPVAPPIIYIPETPKKVSAHNPKKGRSDKMRATSWIWFGSGYGHNPGLDEKNARKLIAHIKFVFDLTDKEVI